MAPTNEEPTSGYVQFAEGQMIDCPACGKEQVELVRHPARPGRLVGYHACLGMGERPVLETDAPDAAVVNPYDEGQG